MHAFLYRIGAFAARRPWRVIGTWLAAAVLVFTAAGTVGGELTDNYNIPGMDSQRGIELLREGFPDYGGTSTRVVVAADDGRLAPGVLADVGHRLAALPDVTAVSPPKLSADGGTAVLTVQYDAPVTDIAPEPAVAGLEAAAAPARDAGYATEFGGEILDNLHETGSAESFGLMAALLILVIAFGSLLAAGLPVAMALAGLGTGFGLITIVAGFTTISTSAPVIASMVGIGVGIDYALFIVARHRQQLLAGDDVVSAVATANATAGRSVVFAAATVIVAIFGLALGGIPDLFKMGLATALVVLASSIAAVTLLPALLGLAKFRVLGRRTKREQVLRREAFGRTTASARWAEHASRHPWRYALVALVGLLALAAPTLSMRIGESDAGARSPQNTERRAYDLVDEAFGPGANGPLTIAVDLERAGVPAERIAADLAQAPGVAAVDPPLLSPSGEVAVITVVPTTGPQDEATEALVKRLRADVLPAGASITGWTAVFVDISDRLADRLPLVVGVVVLASFVLLMLLFRSVVVPLKAAVMNLLSIGAAYGVIVALFQWGWGTSLLGLDKAVPISPWVPVMMFAILFGLSMDYEVFLLSRIREEWERRGSTRDAVVAGLGTSARVITSAALIMVTVFLGFALEVDPLIKMMGVGFATAVLIDATVVRMMLVPATMVLLGEANWWLPRWLDRRLPHVTAEHSPARRHGQLAPHAPHAPHAPEPELV